MKAFIDPKDPNRYDDMLQMEHHRSSDRPHMSMHDRAAIFSPFAALTGHQDAINETGRLTEQKTDLTEDQKEELDHKLTVLRNSLSTRPMAEIRYFVPDSRKEGGSYEIKTGIVKRIDDILCQILFEDGSCIDTEDIVEISILQSCDE